MSQVVWTIGKLITNSSCNNSLADKFVPPGSVPKRVRSRHNLANKKDYFKTARSEWRAVLFLQSSFIS